VVSDAGKRVVFAPAANGYGSPYASFSFVANDGELESLPGMITVNISPPVSPTVTACGATTNGGFQLIFKGGTNTTYCVWASTNLATWEYLGPAAQTAPAQFLFLDDSAKNLAQRFYRLSTGCLAPAPQFTGYSRSSSGNFEVYFSGSTNAAYRVWASTNLVNWQVLGMATGTTAGTFRFMDTSGTNWPQRFYRAGTP
jgi:hypothetical protein